MYGILAMPFLTAFIITIIYRPQNHEVPHTPIESEEDRVYRILSEGRILALNEWDDCFQRAHGVSIPQIRSQQTTRRD